MAMNIRPDEIAQLQAYMKVIENACDSIQMGANQEAHEQTLLHLRLSPCPYLICQYILEYSQSARARVEATRAIGHAAMRDWSSLEGDVKRTLVSSCLPSMIKDGKLLEAVELLKRGWLDLTSEDKEPFFSKVKEAVSGVHGLDVQFVGISFLESLVSEFSPTTSSAMGRPREFHEQCRISLEQDYMKELYSWVQHAALTVSDRITEAKSEIPELMKVCSAALRLMLQILNCDFQSKMQDFNSLKTSGCFFVQPGPDWRAVLISSGHIEWLLTLYAAIRKKFPRDCPLAVSARKLIVQFCSLTGTIFESDSGYMPIHHFLQLLKVILKWLEPTSNVYKAIRSGKSESELLDGCRALMSLATVTSPLKFNDLLPQYFGRPYATFGLLHTVTCEVCRDFMENNREEGSCSWVARDILLDTWSILVMKLDCSGYNQAHPDKEFPAVNLFSLFLDLEFKAASKPAVNDNNFQASIAAMDKRLSSYALIARAIRGSALTKLFEYLSKRITICEQYYFNQPGLYETVTLKELYFLLLITGHVLADEGQGETPSVPKEIENHYHDVQKLSG